MSNEATLHTNVDVLVPHEIHHGEHHEIHHHHESFIRKYVKWLHYSY